MILLEYLVQFALPVFVSFPRLSLPWMQRDVRVVT